MSALGAVHILPTADMETAVRFWRDVVGCAERFATPTFSEVAAGRSVICLRPSSKPGGRSGLAVDVASWGRGSLKLIWKSRGASGPPSLPGAAR
jgi:hypothetical protein